VLTVFALHRNTPGNTVTMRPMVNVCFNVP